MSSKKAQAALEYLTTYGWAILAALVSLGAISYFGFMNPTALLPDKCDFGKQLECVDYIVIKGAGSGGTSAMKITFRNNFGKDVEITAAQGDGLDPTPTTLPLLITAGSEAELVMDAQDRVTPGRGDKGDYIINITFRRADMAGSPEHTLIGSLFTAVQ